MDRNTFGRPITMHACSQDSSPHSISSTWRIRHSISSGGHCGFPAFACTWSLGLSGRQARLERLHGTFGAAGRVVMLPHSFRSGLAQTYAENWVVVDSHNLLGQVVRIFGLKEHAAASLLDHLRKRAVARHYDWNAAGHCLKHRESFGFVVDRWR